MDKTKIVIESKLENLELARNLLCVVVSKYNPTLTFLNELKTIISEGVTNSIIHGYENRSDGLITLEVCCDISSVEVSIYDNGVGISDIEMAKKPMYSTKTNSDRSGLGFTIMEVFSDCFMLESKLGEYTKITFIKKLSIIEE